MPAHTYPGEPAKQTQEDNGVRITVAHYSYEAKRTTFNLVHTVPTLIVVNNHQPGELQEFPRIDVVPHTLRFKVSVYNRLDRVVRMAGTAVAFQVAGKTVAVDKANYDDFLNGIILPRQEGDFDIAGPEINDLPNHATIGLFLYDVVTATDAAGNPTKRSNFEFYYTLSFQTNVVTAPVVTKHVWLDENNRVIGDRY